MSIPPPGPLSYEGMVSIPFINKPFPPPLTTYKTAPTPTIFLDTAGQDAYISVAPGNWKPITQAQVDVIGTLTGNSGGSVGPTDLGNVNLVGDGTTIAIVGNPGTNTLTVSLLGSSAAIEKLLPDSGTTPVIPTSGSVTIGGGTLSGIQTIGGTNSLQVATNFAKANTATGALSFYDPSITTAFFTYVSPNSIGTFALDTLSNEFSVSGQNIQMGITNLSSTANSSASYVSTCQDASGDAYYLCNPHASVSPGNLFMFGQTQANLFQINYATTRPNNVMSSASGFLNLFNITTTGARTIPSQPAFNYVLTTDATSVTGDGTVWSFGTTGGAAVTKQYDQGNNVAVTAGVVTFTAPVTGIYYFQAMLNINSLSSTMTTGQTVIVLGSGGSAFLYLNNVGAVRDNSNNIYMNGSAQINMAAGDTAVLRLTISNGAKAATVKSATTFNSWFAGYLVC